MILKKLVPKVVRKAMRRCYATALYTVKVLPVRHRVPEILSAEETLQRILDNRLSVCRYGDGELNIIRGAGNGFCSPDSALGERLEEILSYPHEKEDNILICIPGVIHSLARDTTDSRYFWHLHFSKTIKDWIRYCHRPFYGDALISRFYINYLDRDYAARVTDMWKRIWDGRKLLIVEGAESRLGVGNDLFDNAADIKRILCPGKNAFDSYDEILEAARRHAEDRLVLIALGQTATVLAYDLAMDGFQALDIGHIDVEYEWFRMGVTEKVDIPTKAVNEVMGLDAAEVRDPVYLSQIVERIGI